MMEAIGMTRRQLARMLMLEGVYYAGFTILASLGSGLYPVPDPCAALSEDCVHGLPFCHMAHAAGVPDTVPFGRRRAISGLASPEKESVVSVISREA